MKDTKGYYVQRLENRVIDLLDREDFQPLFDTIKDDKDLLFEVRKGFPIVYYLGCKIIGIRPYYKKQLSLSIDSKYATLNRRRDGNEKQNYDEEAKKLLDEMNKNRFDYTFWKENLKNVKRIIGRYRDNVAPNEERKKQQRIAKANNDFDGEVIIFDTEYGVRKEPVTSSKLCKIDMTGVCKNDRGKYDITVIELKVGDGAVEGTAGVGEHIKDFGIILNSRKDDLKQSILNIFEIKKRYGIFEHCPEELVLSGEYRAVVLAYDLDKMKKPYKEKYIDKNIETEGYKLTAAAACDDRDKLTKEFLFGDKK